MSSEWVSKVGSAVEQAFASADPDEMAYLALTSKVELPTRDRIAYELHCAATPTQYVSREWKKTDLAVVEHGEPALLLEAKALYSFDAVREKTLAKYSGYIDGDIDKARKLAGPDTTVVIALVVTHVSAEVSADLESIAKYRWWINKSLEKYPDTAVLHTEASRRIGEMLSSKCNSVPVRNSISGTVWDIPVRIDVWIAGAA